MRSISEIFELHKNVYVWDHDNVLDVCNFNTKISLINFIKSFDCMYCDNAIINGNAKLVNDLAYGAIKGVKITCNSCKSKYFIHDYMAIKDANFKSAK